jgi:hypothetical protein
MLTATEVTDLVTKESSTEVARVALEAASGKEMTEAEILSDPTLKQEAIDRAVQAGAKTRTVLAGPRGGLKEEKFFVDPETGIATANGLTPFTVDGGAGGVEILDWYNNHKGPFWVYLAYDKYINFSKDDQNRYIKLGQYNQIIEMYISDFNYSVQKRGGSNYDFWNISITLEEV